jgi:ketosteroid isomerase-like protein
MHSILKAALFATILACCGASATEVPSYIGRRVSTPEDAQAIRKVVEDFQFAIKTKDARQLSSLMLSSNMLFRSPARPETIKNVREKIDRNFDGIPEGGFRDFLNFVANEKRPVEERFYNVQITQDDNVAWVMFDYDFLLDNKATNHGVENWQLMKNAEGQWKIVSVVWTMHAPK